MNLGNLLKPISGTLIVTAVAISAAACSSTAAPQQAATPSAPQQIATPASKAATPAASAKPAVSSASEKPAAQSASAAKNLIVYGDTVRGPVGLTDDEKPVLTCVQQNRFPQGSDIVFRFRVIDPATGQPMDDKQLKSLTLTLPDGKTQALRYGPHTVDKAKKENDVFWTTSFKVPDTYPTGSFNYKIEAVDNNGRTGTYVPFKVPAALLQIVPAGKR